MMSNMQLLAILAVLELIIGSMADICFEGTPQLTFRGPLFSIQGQESDGRLCVTVVRDEANVDNEDFESFQYSTFQVSSPFFGDGVAIAGADYTAVSGATVNFLKGSTNVTFCVDLILDDFACEGKEDFGIQLISNNPVFNTVCNAFQAIATIEDSTVIHIGFTSSTAEVSENAGSVSLSVTRFSGSQNFNPAQVMVMEDPDTPGCLASSSTISYPCVAPRCSDGVTFDLTKDIVSMARPRLVADDNVIDCHKECQILLKPVGSTCLFNLTRERMQLIVRDNERFFIDFSPSFYEEEEDKAGVNVTVIVKGFGNATITVTQPVNFTLSISTDGVDNPVDVGVDLPNRKYSGSIPPGQSSTSVRILFTPDDVYEDTEVFELILTPSGDKCNLIPPLSNAIIQIANDDNVLVRFAASQLDAYEGARISVQAYRVGRIQQQLRIRVQTEQNTAQRGLDYRLKTKSLVFKKLNSNIEVKNVVVEIKKDSLSEGSEDFSLVLDVDDDSPSSQQKVKVTILDL